MPMRPMEGRSKLHWRRIKVKDNMSGDVQTVESESYVVDAARLMREQNIGCVFVKEDGKVVGIITDRDITCRVTGDDLDPRATTAKTIMTTITGRCSENDYLDDAARIMMEMRVRRLPVFSRSEDFVGVLSVGDLSAHTDHTLLGEVMGKLYQAHK